MSASTDTFITHVASHAGVANERAEQATRAVLGGLGSYLTEPTRRFVADELPAPLGLALLQVAGLAVPLEERVLGRGMTAGRAHELVACVCLVLSEELSSQALRALRAAVPTNIARLLAPPASEVSAPAPDRRRYDTLAGGRPGSRRPISEAPLSRRQVGSIDEANPHGATKLSSSPGTTQERRHDSLADARPGYDDTLAGPRR